MKPETSLYQNLAAALTKTVRLMFAMVVVFVFIAAGEFGQYMKSNHDVRENTIAQWVAKNPSGKSLAERFENQCLASVPTPKPRLSMDDKLISVYACGDGIGAYELVDAIKRSDSILVSVAWPLSLVANNQKDKSANE